MYFGKCITLLCVEINVSMIESGFSQFFLQHAPEKIMIEKLNNINYNRGKKNKNC